MIPVRPRETKTARRQRRAWEALRYGTLYPTLLAIRALPEVSR